MKRYLSSFPHLVREWDSEKNAGLEPQEFTHGSHKVVWWLCEKQHSFQMPILKRTGRGDGCPYCSGKKASAKYNLKIKYPLIANEWNDKKNGKLFPSDVTPGSNTKVWWLCPVGHEYDMPVKQRTGNRSQGCPFCSGKRPSAQNNLSLQSNLVLEWNKKKNKGINPENYTLHSQKKVWWICPNGHEYRAAIGSRTGKSKSGCPYCSGNKVSKNNNIKKLFPDLIKQWDLTKNNNLKPENFTRGSNKNIWWTCDNGHSYQQPIKQRCVANQGCPYCSGNKVSKDNNLFALFPEIAKEWDFSRNKKLLPENFVAGSNQKVWWRCAKGHEYLAAIGSRTGKNKTGCPYCTNQTSRPELRILTEIMAIFNNVEHRSKKFGVEVDIFIPSFKLAIEFDGYHFHSEQEEKDLKKNKTLKAKGISIIRVRDAPLGKLTKYDVVTSKTNTVEKRDIDRLLHSVFRIKKKTKTQSLSAYLKRDSFKNEKVFREYMNFYPNPNPERSLLNTHPEIAGEWNFEKNKPLSPASFTYGSKIVVWWLCPEGHQYDMAIGQRTRPRPQGCPYCAGRRVGDDNNLLVRYPDLAREWHQEKNGDRKPSDFTSGSQFRAWWTCEKGHEWNTMIKDRKKHGCPFCARKKRTG